MTIEFTRNARPTVGVEMELHLVDAVTGELASASNEILAEMGAAHPGGEHPKAKHELFQSTVEIITGVCETPAEAGDDLRTTIDELRSQRRTTRTHHRQLGHPSVRAGPRAARQPATALPRSHRGSAVAGSADADLRHARARRRPRRRAGDRIIGELMRHHPLFLALSSSSPYFEGEDSGLASARTKLFEGLPTAGPAAAAGGLGGLRGVHVDAARLGVHLLDQRGLVGHPAASRLRHRRVPDVRCHADGARNRRARCPRPDAGRVDQSTHRRRFAPAASSRVDRPREPLARRPLRHRRRTDRRAPGHRPSRAAAGSLHGHRPDRRTPIRSPATSATSAISPISR